MQGTEAVAMIAVFGTLGASVVGITKMTLSHIRFQRLSRLQGETMSKILDKLGGSPETLEWLRTGDMKRFFDLQVERSTNPQFRILNAIQIGLISLSLGIGFWSFSSIDPDMVWKLIGTALVSLGVGFVASATISYLLSKQWGLLERSER